MLRWDGFSPVQGRRYVLRPCCLYVLPNSIWVVCQAIVSFEVIVNELFQSQVALIEYLEALVFQ